MRRRVGLLVLAGLTVLAGCSTFVSPSASTETVTPAPVPAATTSTAEAGGPLPPGLTGGGVTDVGSLASAHLDTIRNRSYTWQAHTYFGETNSTQTLKVEAPRHYTYQDAGRGSRINTSDFADGETVYTRYHRFVERLRRAPAPNATDQYGPLAAKAIERYLAVENATVAETLVGGERHYLVRTEMDRYPAIEGATNYSVEAVIAPDGFVRELTVSYVNRGGTRPLPVRYHYRYDRVGTTTISEPTWFTDDEWATNPTETASGR